ncbi:MAG: hypothetical protein AB7F89_13225, partial [Pirellulaceae bacterium]
KKLYVPDPTRGGHPGLRKSTPAEEEAHPHTLQPGSPEPAPGTMVFGIPPDFLDERCQRASSVGRGPLMG